MQTILYMFKGLWKRVNISHLSVGEYGQLNKEEEKGLKHWNLPEKIL